MSSKPAPVLPHGASPGISGLSETFSFHSSPEIFITSRLSRLAGQHPDLANSRTTVRAKVLNRDIAIVSSYAQVQHILAGSQGNNDEYGNRGGGGGGGRQGADSAFSAAYAYEQFMAPFYPSPNLLLLDGHPHKTMRVPWEARMQRLDLNKTVQRETMQHFSAGGMDPSPVDLYSTLKTLSWRILLSLFLDLRDDDSVFAEVEELQEDLLRGQFSLMPVSINVGFWHSPRKKGIDAKKKLQKLIFQRLQKRPGSCPFNTGVQDGGSFEDSQLEDITNHLIMFSSSLAVKGMASLLTAFLLNVFLFRRLDTALVEELSNLGKEDKTVLLRSILLETERLSPPIVGIMRRATCETILPTADSLPDIRIPKGWDVWLYFVGAGRDPNVFGKSSDSFIPERHLESEDIQEGFAFSSGSKTCLGKEMMRSICLTIANTMVDNRIRIEGEVHASGVREWLGWNSEGHASLEDWGKDMKQLPTQHPAKPVMVRIVSTRGKSDDEELE